MIRRFTSSPKPASRVARITSSALASGLPSGQTRRPYRIASNFARLLDASAGRIR